MKFKLMHGNKAERVVMKLYFVLWFSLIPIGLVIWHITDDYRYIVIAIGCDFIIFPAITLIMMPREPEPSPRKAIGTVVGIFVIVVICALLACYLWIWRPPF